MWGWLIPQCTEYIRSTKIKISTRKYLRKKKKRLKYRGRREAVVGKRILTSSMNNYGRPSSDKHATFSWKTNNDLDP